MKGRQWRKYFSALRLVEIRFYTLITSQNWIDETFYWVDEEGGEGICIETDGEQ